MPMTFRVNLETVDLLNYKQPYNRSTENDGFSASRSTWFADLLRDNRALKHGDTIVVSGVRAVYLRNNFTSGEFKFLDYVSGTSV